MPCSRMTRSPQPNEHLPQRQKAGTTAEVEEKGVVTIKIGREGMSIKIRDEPIITTYSEGLENESTRIRGGITVQNRHDSRCHHLNSSRSFNLFKGSSGLDLKGVIQREGTNPDIASIIRTSNIEPMNDTGSEGC